MSKDHKKSKKVKKYQNVSLVNLPLSPFDIIILNKMEDGSDKIQSGIPKLEIKNPRQAKKAVRD